MPEGLRDDPNTAQSAAVRWVETVMDKRDLGAAWSGTDPVLRLVLAQDWVWTNRHRPGIGHNRDWDEVAGGLAAGPGGHRLWPVFAKDVVERWHALWKGFSARSWDVSDDPEVVDLDLEIVTFVERDGQRALPGTGSGAFARRFAMRYGPDGWQVASVNGEQFFVPGWPPSLQV